jgi:hypothetical protein
MTMNGNRTILDRIHSTGNAVIYTQFTRGMLAGFFAISSLLQSILVPVPTDEALQSEISKIMDKIELTAQKPKPVGEHYTVVRTLSHTVKEGENIYSISRDLKKQNIWVTPKQLILWNELEGPEYFLRPGRIITVNDLYWDKQILEASWYGPGFHGRPMANTKIFNQNDIVAAHMYLPLNMKVRVTNVENGRSLIIPITDRGNFEKYNRGIDLSKQAAKELGYQGAGVTQVLIEPLHTL